MAKYLVIVESPAKAKTINKFLGSNYHVVASNGHVRDLPKSRLGIDVEDDYEGKLYVYKVNTNFDKELAKEYQIAANPTLLFVKNAEVLDRKIGAHTLAELKTWVEALL